jgi:hypothetical protein
MDRHVRHKAGKHLNLWVDWRPLRINCRLEVEDGQEGRDGEPDRVFANELSQAHPGGGRARSLKVVMQTSS